MTFVDLNLENALLSQQEKKLGFSIVQTPNKVLLKSGRDLALVKEGVCVESENTELLRAAAKKKVLVNPFFVKSFFKDEGLIRAVAEGKAIFEVPVGVILTSSGTKRAKAIRDYSLFLRKCVKLKANYCLTSRAKTIFDLKTPFEVAAIGELLGLSREQAQAAIGIYPGKWL